MALWLVAVIVLIAVGAMPSEARAHGGHPHASAGLAPAAMAGSDATIGPVSSIEIKSLGITSSGTGSLAVAAKSNKAKSDKTMSGKAVASGPCDGACGHSGCRGAGSCCTGAGLAPEAVDSAGPRGPSARALARALPARTDVLPEALPEPPRFHA